MRFLLVLAAIVAMGPSLAGEFTSLDDWQTIAGNPDFNPPTIKSVAGYWTRPAMDLYIPFTYTVWGIVATVSRYRTSDGTTYLNPWIFHSLNVGLHAFAGLAVMEMVALLTSSSVWAMVSGLAFVTHPLQVEAVAWVSGGKDVLSAACTLWALVSYLKAVSSKPERWSKHTAAGVLFLLAILSKPSAIVMPLLAFLLDWSQIGRPARQVIRSTAYLFVIAAPFTLITSSVQVGYVSVEVSPLLRPLVAGGAIGSYLLKLIFPVRLCIDYGMNPHWWTDHALHLTTAAVATAAWLAMSAALTRRSPAKFALLAMTIALLPTLGFVSFDYLKHSVVVDHYFYVAMIGPAWLIGWAAARCKVIARYIFPLFTVGWITLSILQCLTWHDSLKLYTHAVEVVPDSLAGNTGLGNRAAAHGKYEEAVGWFRRSMIAHPDDPDARYLYCSALLCSSDDPKNASDFRMMFDAERDQRVRGALLNDLRRRRLSESQP